MAKRNGYQFWVPIIVVILVVAALGIGIKVAVQPIDNSGSCKQIGRKYTMTITNNSVTPENIDAKHCDTLTIKNSDSQDHVVMFGHHEDMKAYDGILQRTLPKGESLTVTLAQVGSFHFHDDETKLIGTFSVQ